VRGAPKIVVVVITVIALGVAIMMLRPKGRALIRGMVARPDNNPAHQAVNSKPLVLPLIEPRIEIFKSKRELTLYSGGVVVRVFRVGLGSDPKNDKRTEGDGRTPEGDFVICSKNPKSNYYLSVGLNYPNEEDAERGLRDGLISTAQRDQIVASIRARDCPPWNTKLGGEVFIHGNGSGSDWTLGCIALDDRDIREVFDAIPKNTPVKINP